jgi:hypothetical protein
LDVKGDIFALGPRAGAVMACGNGQMRLKLTKKELGVSEPGLAELIT